MARGKQGEIAKYLQEEFLNYLEQEAKKFLDRIISGVDYTHRTYNLYDSYAYGIFLNGSLRRTSATKYDKDDNAVSVGVRAPKATKPRYWYGDEVWGKWMRDEMFQADGFKPSRRGYVVVFAAAMPYAVVLEAGGGSGPKRDFELSHKYKVISYMENEAMNFGSDLMKNMVTSVKSEQFQARQEWRV